MNNELQLITTAPPKEMRHVVYMGLPAHLSKKTSINTTTRAKYVGFVESYDREHLYFQIFVPAVPPRAIVLVGHGFGEHVGPFEELGVKLCDNDYCVIMYDQRGFGRSGGKRGHMIGLDQFLVDCLTVVDACVEHLCGQIGQYVQKLEIFLYGHSTGSLGFLILSLEVSKIVLYGRFNRLAFLSMLNSSSKKKKKKVDELQESTLCLLEKYLMQYAHSIKGCIATAPYLRVSPHGSEWQKKIVKFIGKRYNRYTVALQVSPEKFTSDLKMQMELAKDDLRITEMTMNQLFVWEGVASILLTSSLMKEFILPLVVIHGGHDVVADITESKRFYAQVASSDKQYEFLFGFLHGLHIEKQRERVMKSVLTWLNNRCRPESSAASCTTPTTESKIRMIEMLHKKRVQQKAKFSTSPDNQRSSLSLRKDIFHHTTTITTKEDNTDLDAHSDFSSTRDEGTETLYEQ